MPRTPTETNLPATTLPDREIFKVGKWRGSATVEADTKMLDQMVKSYEELNSKISGYAIPLKLGHNKKIGEPAMGFAENVRREGNVLMADFVDMPPEIVDAINQKRYNAVSVEIWPKIDHAGQTFEQVLGGVALLGAEWPAVKGLKPLYASELPAEGCLTLSQEEDEDMTTFTQEQHDAILAAAVDKATKDLAAAHATELAAATDRADKAEQRAQTAEAAVAIFQDDAEKAELSAVIEAAEKEGKIVPANKPAVIAFADGLRKSIKSEDRKSVLEMFTAFVSGLPKKVDFSEHTGGDNDAPSDRANASDEVNDKVQAKITAAGGLSKLSYKDAMAIVFKEDPALKTRYAEETR